MSLRRLADERGQVLPMLAAGLAVVLLGFVALVVDVGHAYLAQRQLQAGADAAALAGAQLLPDAAAAKQRAAEYSNDPANRPSTVDGVQTEPPATGCLGSATSCTAVTPDAISVTRSATVPMTFARVFGIDSVNVEATASAARTASTKPYDIALVLDRTESMSGEMGHLIDSANDDLLSAIATVNGEVASDALKDQVALVVLPPNQSCDRHRRQRECHYYPAGNGGYLLRGLTSDIASVETLVKGLSAGGTTSYKQALIVAANELLHGPNARPDARKAIVFETDGAANTVPEDAYSPLSWLGNGYATGRPASGRLDDIMRPCGSAVDYARSAGIPIYTIDFDHSDDHTCYEAPHDTSSGSVGWREHGHEESITAPVALQQIAQVSRGRPYLAEDQSQLQDAFAQIATAFQAPRLVPDESVVRP